MNEEIVRLILIGIVFSAAAAWLTELMLLEKVDEFEGPFKTYGKIVHFPLRQDGDVTYPAHYQAVAAQDWLRRFFRVYDVVEATWTVNYDQAEVWMCPRCLITWLTVPFSITLTLMGGYHYLPFYIIIHLAMCAVGKFIYERV